MSILFQLQIRVLQVASLFNFAQNLISRTEINWQKKMVYWFFLVTIKHTFILVYENQNFTHLFTFKRDIWNNSYMGQLVAFIQWSNNKKPFAHVNWILTLNHMHILALHIIFCIVLICIVAYFSFSNTFRHDYII